MGGAQKCGGAQILYLLCECRAPPTPLTTLNILSGASLAALKFAIIYIFSSIFSMVASSLLSPQSVTVGASGALFGLFGAYLAELITNCHLLSFRDGLCAFASLGFSIAINLAIGLLPVSGGS